MSTAQKVTKKFAKSYLLLLEQSQTMLANFNDDLAAFTARYPHLDAAYAAAWQTAIANADSAPADEQVVSDQKQKTFTLTDTMKLAAEKYSYLASFLKVAFRNNSARVLDHFGIKPSRKGRVRQMRQKELLAVAYERANSATYKPDLLAKGYTQAEIDELNALSQQLNTDNVAQEKSKTDRPEMSQARIALYNAVWDIMTEVHDASLTVFADDYARQQHYLLYPEKNQLRVIEVEQHVIAPFGIVNTGAVPAGTQEIRMTGIVSGPMEFGLSNDGSVFIGNTTSLSAPASTTYALADFGVAGAFFIVKNQNGMLNGEFKVEFLG